METNTIYNSLQILLYHYLDKEQEEREETARLLEGSFFALTVS